MAIAAHANTFTARWTFDGSLTAAPTTYNGTATGTIAYATGQVGTQALSLDGTNYVTTPFVLNPTANFTVTTWVRPTVTSGDDQTIQQQADGSGTGRGWLYRKTDGRIATFLGNAETASTGTVPLNTWTHVALVNTGGTLQLYINGVADGSASRTIETCVGLMRIGAHKSQTTKNWTGQIDDLRLYSLALNSTQIASLFTENAPLPPAAPSNLAAVAASFSQIYLTWTDNATTEAGFKLERSLNGTTGWSQIATPATNATNTSDSGLTASTTYYYRIRATNATGDSSYTTNASATTTTTAYVPVSYYVSPDGNDINNGTSTGSAWQTLAKVNGQTFSPGDTISFEGGQTFSGTLTVVSSGSPGNPITYTSYGTGRATINSGNSGGLRSSQSYLSISKLNFVGAGYTVNTGRGMDFSINSDAQVNYIRLNEIEVSGYGGNGILFQNRINGTTEYGYHDVQVTSVSSHDNKNNGFNATGSNVNAATYAHSNFLIQDSQFYRNHGFPASYATGNGITMADMNGALIDRCVAYENGFQCTATGGGPVGIWSWDSNNVIIQYSEAYKNGNAGSYDGGGFDIDGGNTNCIIQYCYSHENEGAGYLIAQFFNANRPQRNNVIRYNISVNDATLGVARNHGAIHIWNSAGNNATDVRDVSIYGNTVYQSVGPDALRTADTATTNTRIFNNIFIAANGKKTLNIQQTGGITLQGNLYWGSSGEFGVKWGATNVTSLSAFQTLGQEKIGATPVGRHADPLVTSPGAMPTINDPSALALLTAYQLTAASPAIDAGISVTALIGTSTTTGSGPAISHPGTSDFWGNTVPLGAAYDIGAQEASGLTIFRIANDLTPNGSEDLLTPAADGMANLLKYAFNMLGNGPGQTTTLDTPNTSVLTPVSDAGLPYVGVESTGPADGKLQITYVRRKAISNPGITYAVVFSDTLDSFEVNPSATETTQDIDATFESVTVTDSAVSSKRFARVKVLEP